MTVAKPDAPAQRRLWITTASVLLTAGALLALLLSWPSADTLSERNVTFVRMNDRGLHLELIFAHPKTAPEGLMHYTEHLVWQSAIDQRRAERARSSNAWTSPTAVAYWLQGDAGDAETLARTLAGVFDPIAIDADFAAEETGIVQREYDLAYANDVEARAERSLRAFLYEGTWLARSVLGTPEQIAGFTLEAAQALHAETHLPDRARLLITGDVGAATATRLADLIGIHAGPRPVAPAFDLAGPAEKTFFFPDGAAAPRLILRRVVALPAPWKFERLDLASGLLGDTLESALPGGLAGPLRFNARIAEILDVSVWAIDARHVELWISARPDTGVSLTALAGAISETLLASAETIPDATVERLHARMLADLPDFRDPEARSDWLAEHAALRMSELRAPSEPDRVRALAEALGPGDIRALLAALTGPSRSARAFIGPEERFR